MSKVTKPRVRTLATGSRFGAKLMQGNAGELLPNHTADVESIMFIHEGECVIEMDGEDIPLKAGDALIIPPGVRHQFKVIADLKGVHFMPNEIKFEFFD